MRRSIRILPQVMWALSKTKFNPQFIWLCPYPAFQWLSLDSGIRHEGDDMQDCESMQTTIRSAPETHGHYSQELFANDPAGTQRYWKIRDTGGQAAKQGMFNMNVDQLLMCPPVAKRQY